MSPQGFKCPLKYSLLSHGTAGHCPVLLKLIRSRVFLDGDIMNIPDKTRTLKSDELKYWFFATTSNEEINKIYSSLRSQNELDSSNYTSQVFIIDKQRNQRGRIDDRSDDQIENNIDIFGLYSYNSIIVSEIKKKMNDDIRILFTEYRQKRKGNFNSNIRRISNLDGNDK